MTDPGSCLVNGKAGQLISIHDRGLQFADGVFETLAVQNGLALCWDEHFQRLQTGCERLSLPCPEKEQLAREAAQLCRGLDLAVLKIMLTRGEGGRGYLPVSGERPNRVLLTYDWPAYPAQYPAEGIHSFICKRRIGHNPALAGIKHLSRLEQVLLRKEVADAAFPEGVALDPFANVIEGSMSNLFLVKGGTLITPDLTRCGVAGVIRERIIKMNAEQVTVREVKTDELYSADELFYCNSLIGIWPVKRLGEKRFKAHAVTFDIQSRLLCENNIARY